MWALQTNFRHSLTATKTRDDGDMNRVAARSAILITRQVYSTLIPWLEAKRWYKLVRNVIYSAIVDAQSGKIAELTYKKVLWV